MINNEHYYDGYTSFNNVPTSPQSLPPSNLILNYITRASQL